MKQLFLFCLLALLAGYQVTMSSCTGCNRPEPNFQGVLMQNCGKNGIADFTNVFGSQGPLGPCSELYQVALFDQRADPAPLFVTTNDGGTFEVDPQYRYKAIDTFANVIIFNYRHNGPKDDEFFDNIENGTLNPIVYNIYREEARNFTTDSLLRNMAKFELAAEKRCKKEFYLASFRFLDISSGLKPPKSMIDAIERKNNVAQATDQERQELEKARIRLEKAKIERETDLVKSQGLTKEILTDKYIEALRNTQNKVIITDGKTPVILEQ